MRVACGLQTSHRPSRTAADRNRLAGATHTDYKSITTNSGRPKSRPESERNLQPNRPLDGPRFKPDRHHRTSPD